MRVCVRVCVCEYIHMYVCACEGLAADLNTHTNIHIDMYALTHKSMRLFVVS